MALVRIEGTLEAIRSLREFPGIKLFLSTVEELETGKVRMAAEAPDHLIPGIIQRGCQVQVAMSDQDIARFHREVSTNIAPPESQNGPGPNTGPAAEGD